MQETTSNFTNDLNIMSEQDMFALSEVLAMIEPGAGGTTTNETSSISSWVSTIFEASYFPEVATAILIMTVSGMMLYPFARKTRLLRFIFD